MLLNYCYLNDVGSLDGIHSSEFGEWLMTEGDQVVLGQQTIRSIRAIGGIIANTINNVHVDRLLTETRRIDVNETMDHVIFSKLKVILYNEWYLII